MMHLISPPAYAIRVLLFCGIFTQPGFIRSHILYFPSHFPLPPITYNLLSHFLQPGLEKRFMVERNKK